MIPSGAYGLLAEFETPEALIAATKQAHAKGYRKMDAHSPFPVHGLQEALGIEGTEMPLMVFIGGMLGVISGLALQYYCAVIAYPVNVGGRPLWSWPAFVPVAFECGVLFSAATAVFGMFIRNNLPQPYHPVFNSSRFDRASTDRFFLCIESTDPLYDQARTTSELQSWAAIGVEELQP